MILTFTPRCAAACSMRSNRYCSFFAGGRLRYSSGDNHPSHVSLESRHHTRGWKEMEHPYSPKSRPTLEQTPAPWRRRKNTNTHLRTTSRRSPAGPAQNYRIECCWQDSHSGHIPHRPAGPAHCPGAGQNRFRSPPRCLGACQTCQPAYPALGPVRSDTRVLGMGRLTAELRLVRRNTDAKTTGRTGPV